MSKEGAVIEVTSAQVCCPSVLDAPLDATEAAELAKAFAALADLVRLRVLSILAAAPAGEVCVRDFVEPLGKTFQTLVGSRQRRVDLGSLRSPPGHRR
jgi:ArsR family transcriptional regulator